MSKKNSERYNGMAYSREEWNEIQKGIKEARKAQHLEFYGPKPVQRPYTLLGNIEGTSGL